MQRSGQCKCGAVLKFEQGPTGYKGRCPKCGAVVRLRVAEGPIASAPEIRKAAIPPRPSDPRLSVVALREPGPAVPGEPDPDATTPFEPIDEIELEPWTPPPEPPKPSFLRRHGLGLALGGAVVVAVAVVVVLWLRAS